MGGRASLLARCSRRNAVPLLQIRCLNNSLGLNFGFHSEEKTRPRPGIPPLLTHWTSDCGIGLPHRTGGWLWVTMFGVVMWMWYGARGRMLHKWEHPLTEMGVDRWTHILEIQERLEAEAPALDVDVEGL